MRLVLVAELQPAEADEQDHGRPASEPRRVGQRRRPRASAAQAGVCPSRAAGDGQPGVEGAEEIPEQHAGHDHAHPEVDVGEHRREVRVRLVLDAREPCVDHQGEQGDPDRPGRHVEPIRKAPDPAPVLLLELGLRPERRQRRERHDEHDRSGPREQPRRQRQIGLSLQSVGGRGGGEHQRPGDRQGGCPGAEPRAPAHGCTFSAAIC